MRGPDAMQESLFTVAKLDDFVPADRPLRAVRLLVDDALAADAWAHEAVRPAALSSRPA